MPDRPLTTFAAAFTGRRVAREPGLTPAVPGKVAAAKLAASLREIRFATAEAAA